MEAEVSLHKGKVTSLNIRKNKTIKTYLEVLSDFTDKSLEGEFADEELGGLLVSTDFTKSDGTRTETMGLLDTTGGGSGSLTSLLGGKLLTRSLASGRFASGLL